jgi:Icc-related predicted phosphoesterase
MKVDKKIRDWLLDIQSNNKIFLEGNILKIIESDTKDEEFTKYIEDANNKDKEIRKKRLDVTKQIQEQNKNLLTAQEENVKINEDLKMALESAEDEKKKAELSKIEAIKAKDDALNDLDILQKKSETELIGTIIKVALIVIMGVGVITTLMYGIAMFTGKDTQIIGSTWSNMLGILLTNAFSIVGTIMGVKYATEKKSDD